MLRKSKLALIALVAAAPLALSVPAGAKPLIDPGFNGPKFPKPFPKPYPKPFPKPHKPHWHPHYRPVIVVEQPIVRQIVQQPVVRNVTRVVSQPAPQTNCLTKEYTTDGMVVFTDLCTKEMAAAALPGSAAAMQQQLQQQGNAQTLPQGNVQIAPQGNVQAIPAQNMTTANGAAAPGIPAGQPVASQTNAQTAAPKAAATDGVAN